MHGRQFFVSWLRKTFGLSRRQATKGASRQSGRRARPAVEQLEERAVPAFGLTGLHLGAATGPEDYVYTVANKVVPTGNVDAGNWYDLVVTRSDGSTSTVVPRTSTNPFTLANDDYTVLAADPASTATAYKFTLHEYASATTGTILKSSTQSFYVAKASSYSDAALTNPQSYFGAGSTAYVRVAGLSPGQKNWNTTWVLPDGTTAAANTAGGDRPDGGGSGVLPKQAASFLQYPLNTKGGDGWNLLANYDTKPTTANST